MERKEYNGWTNYETWLAALWMDNDGRGEMYDERAREIAQEIIDDEMHDAQDIRHALALRLAEEMEEEHHDAIPEQNGLYADLLNAAMREINWHEIAEHYADDVGVWVAGWNMPGYMPDNAPAMFTVHHDARTYIADEMRRDAENAETEEEAEEIESAAEHAENDVDGAETGYGRTVGEYHYWITKV